MPTKTSLVHTCLKRDTWNMHVMAEPVLGTCQARIPRVPFVVSSLGWLLMVQVAVSSHPQHDAHCVHAPHLDKSEVHVAVDPVHVLKRCFVNACTVRCTCWASRTE